MERIKTVLFDFDGTVADTGAGVFASVYYALDQLGQPHPDAAAMRGFLGPPLDYGFRRICGMREDDQVREAIRQYRVFYAREGMLMFTLYDGIEALLRVLRTRGVTAAVASAKPEHFLHRIVAHAGLSPLFSCVGGTTLDNADPSKTAVMRRVMETVGAEPQTTLMVGDRCFDIESAKQLGVRAAGVLYGFGTKEELEACGAEFLLAHPRDLERLLG